MHLSVCGADCRPRYRITHSEFRIELSATNAENAADTMRDKETNGRVLFVRNHSATQAETT